VLYEKVCSDELLKKIKKFQGDELFKNYYLVGGTSLSLQLGHRASVDIDLFTLEEQDNEKIIDYIKNNYEKYEIFNNKENILQVFIDGIKIDFVKAKGIMIGEPVCENGMKLYSIKDIAGMKLNVINELTGRKEAKDYIDIAYLIKELSLPVMFNIYKYKFNKESVYNVKKDLLDVTNVNPFSWQDIKMYRNDIFISDVPNIIKDAVRDYNNLYSNVKENIFDLFKLKSMKCGKYYQIENKEYNDIVSEKHKVQILNDYSDKKLNGDNGCIKKFKYENDYNNEYFVLQRMLMDKNNNYKCDIWHFDNNFNRKSALFFIKKFDERNKLENKNTEHLKFGEKM